jgi:endonuclease-3
MMTTSRMTTSKLPTSGKEAEWDARFRLIAEAIGRDYRASVNRIAEGRDRPDPFEVLVSTIISLRTRDEVTFAASERLLRHAPDPAALQELQEAEIGRLIYPAGFYRTKAHNLRAIATILLDQFGGSVPDTLDGLTSLPGVGRKTANLVLGLGFGIPAICVDIHVHRIPNRLGWIETTSPAASEVALMEILPERFWIPVNELLVRFGQKICTPQSPWCSRCPLAEDCRQVGVDRRR